MFINQFAEIVMIIGCLIGIFLMLLPLKVWTFDGSDAWSHIYDASLYASWRNIPTEAPNFYPKPEFSYPWAVSWLLRVFQPKDPTKFGIKLNLLLMMSEVGLSCVVLLQWASADLVLLYAFIRLTNPLNFSPWSGIYGLNARVIGSTAVNLMVILTPFFWVSATSPIEYVVSLSFLFAVCVVSSQFAMQALIPSILVTSLYFQTPLFLLGACSAYFLLLLISKGRVLEILLGHLKHVKFYARILQHNSATLQERMENPWEWLSRFSKRPIRASFMKLIWVPEFRVFLWNPALLLLSSIWIYFIVTGQTFPEIPGGMYYAIAIFTCLGLVPIINIKGLRFLGEPDRYFTFIGQGAAAVLLASTLTEGAGLSQFLSLGVIPYLAFALLTSGALIYKRSRIVHRYSTKLEQEIVDVINSRQSAASASSDPVVLVNPANRADKFSCLSTFKFPALHTNVVMDEKLWGEYKTLFSAGYPYVSQAAIFDLKIAVDYYVVCKRFFSDEYLMRHTLRKEGTQEIEGLQSLYENEEYEVFGVSN